MQFCFALCLLLIFVVLPPFCPGSPAWGHYLPDQPQEEEDQGSILRFHVRANSNDLSDQQVKNDIAAAILQRFGPAWSGCNDRAELNYLLGQQMEAVAGTAKDILREQGYEGDVAVQLGKSTFPARLYEGQYYPPGEYNALVVVIGTGIGENWWCVIFPPLCFNVVPAPAGSTITKQDQEVNFQAGVEQASPYRENNKYKKADSREKKWRFWLVEYFRNR